jgi:hypothetical protein
MPISQILLTANSGGGGGGGGGGNPTFPPAPGSGSYQSFWPNSAFTTQGGGYIPGGGVASIDNPTAGWYRNVHTGFWSNIGTAGDDNPGLFGGAPDFSGFDTYGGFGTTTTGDNYAIEWKGYIQVTNNDTGVYNFLIDSDDVAMFWIGSAALNPTFSNKLCYSNNDSQLNPNSVFLSNGLYYPIRMRFQEWSGAERCQLYLGQVGSGFNLNSMSNWSITHNGNTGGY